MVSDERNGPCDCRRQHSSPGHNKIIKFGRQVYHHCSRHEPACRRAYRCDSGIVVPSVSSPRYIDSIIQICKENDVQAVFCGSDDELLALAAAREAIEKTGAKLLTGSSKALAIARDKWRTYE